MTKSDFAQHIVITGAASGLGKALATRLGATDRSICVVDINAEEAMKVVDTLQQSGCDAWFVQCDITDQSQVDQLRKAISAKWPRVDQLYNNAGVATAGALQFEDMQQWQWVMEINLLGMVRMCRALVPLMTKGAAIINIASQAGITPIPLMASYNASKAAVVSFSETMHLELANQGIHVSVACPSFFPTNLDKSLRSSQPGIDKLVTKMLKKSDLSADQVANIIIQQAHAKRFMILTHKQGKQAYTLKRFLPSKMYLNMIIKKTKGLLSIRNAK